MDNQHLENRVVAFGIYSDEVSLAFVRAAEYAVGCQGKCIEGLVHFDGYPQKMGRQWDRA